MNSAPPASDTTLHVVPSTKSLDPTWVIDEVTECLSDIGGWITEAQDHEKTALAMWDGQSADGRKWRANYGKKVFPFDGAADSRVHLTGEAIDELTMLEMLAADSAKVQVIAMESTDGRASRKVETLMKYETRQRLRDELWRERNFAKQIKHTFGHAVVHVGWEKRMGTERARATMQDLARLHTESELMRARQRALAEGAQPDENGEVLSADDKMQIADASALMMETVVLSDDVDAFGELLRLAHPLLSDARVKRVFRDIKRSGQAEFPSPYHKPGKPCIRALIPGIEVFYPWWTCPVDRAPWVARIDAYSEPEIRAKVQTDGWSEKAVEALLAMGPERVIDTGVVMESLNASEAVKMFNEPARLAFTQRYTGKSKTAYEVLHVTVNTVDEDGYPATHEIIMHPGLSGKALRDEGREFILYSDLTDYYIDGGCYVEMRREYKSRPLFDSRGVPELAGTHQWLLKSTRDASMDRTSFATMPIVKVNARKAGEGKRWDYEPGSKLSLQHGDEAQYMQPPRLDQGTILDAAEIRRDAANLLGLHNDDLPSGKVMAHQQWIVTNGLLEERKILTRILAMDQQFMDRLQVSRVIGEGPLPFELTREEIAGSYDFILEFDVKSLDMEYLQKRWSALKDAFSIPGLAGQIPTIPVVGWLLNNIDTGLADMVLGGIEERNAQEAEKEKAALAMMLAGVEPDVTESMDAAVRLKAIQDQLRANPNVQAAAQTNASFAQMLDARMRAFEFAIAQRTVNAQTGRTGFKPVISEEAVA